MEKITPAMPSTNLLKNYSISAQPKNESFTSEETIAQPKQEIMSKEAADAAKAYSGVAAVNKKPFVKKSLEDKKTELLAQNKTEGVDFKISDAGKNSKILEIFENGQPSEIFFYKNKNASADDLDGYTKFEYCLNPEATGLKTSMTNYSADGNFRSRTNIYEKDKSPYQDYDINFQTKIDELTGKLKEKNIQFAVDTLPEGEFTTHIVTAFEPDGVNKYEFTNDINGNPVEVRKIKIDENGRELKIIGFSQDETTYTEYKDSFVA